MHISRCPSRDPSLPFRQQCSVNNVNYCPPPIFDEWLHRGPGGERGAIGPRRADALWRSRKQLLLWRVIGVFLFLRFILIPRGYTDSGLFADELFSGDYKFEPPPSWNDCEQAVSVVDLLLGCGNHLRGRIFYMVSLSPGIGRGDQKAHFQI